MATNNTSIKRALLVVDVQNEYFPAGGKFVIRYPDTSVSLPNIEHAMDVAKDNNIPIIVVKHIAPAESPIFARGSHGSELHANIAKRANQLEFEKQYPSCFTGTGLEDFLKSNGINTITVVGYMTHNCDASTIYEATHKGYKCEFLSDATGALPYENKAGFASAEDIHRIYSVVFHTAFASVVTTKEWVEAVKSNEATPISNLYESNLAGVAKQSKQ